MMTFDDIATLCSDKELFERVVTKTIYTQEEAARISAAYLQVFKKKIIRTCGNCLGDALTELVALYRKDQEQMKEQSVCRYTLRAGMLIRLKFGDSTYYTNANLTDRVAEEYILAKSSRLSDFDKYPESIVKRIESDRGKYGNTVSGKVRPTVKERSKKVVESVIDVPAEKMQKIRK